ncbi:MAG: PAS domain-containing sensor histidine kinase [Bdellovibrionaceae bacterium]|nr:PAS domain-containing sensor histidine kinase [Pseudobdellovibrionaceae bacterium]
MTPNRALQRDPQQRLMIESSRVSLYLIILLVSVISYLFSNQFINWTVLAPFYGLILLALCSHLVILSFIDFFFASSFFLFATFVVDSILITALIYFSGANQSLFLFLHLINILIAGLVFRASGGLIIALLTSSLFTVVSVLGPELKALNYFMILGLNNVAYFLIAGLGGYLSEQLFKVDTQLVQTGFSLKQMQELNQFVLSNIPLGLMSFDDQGTVMQSNQSLQQILECPLGTADSILIPFPELKILMDQEVNRGGEQRNEIVKVIGNQEKILGLTLTRTLNPLSGKPLWIGLVEDLTRLKKLEFSLRQSEKMAAVGGLAAGIAHEIRNPLAGISGSVELLSQTTANDDDRKLMKIILREIDRLNHLITEFLDYARPEEPPRDVVDLSSILKEVLAMTRLNQQLRQDVLLEIKIVEPNLVIGKKDKLKQAFLNIIINAYQALQDVSAPKLSVETSLNSAGKVVVRVKDSGVGMKPETLRRMFEPFHTTKPKGTGLGLALTHKILETHNVEVSVESALGQGTEFTLIFPCPPA